jgi:hypothetical protein
LKKVNFGPPKQSFQGYLHRKLNVLVHSRRIFLGTALLGGLTVAVARPAALVRRAALVRPEGLEGQVNPALLQRALDALEQHRGAIEYRDVIGVADFSLPSRVPRFHLVRLADGIVTSHLVAHGRGSDPAHTGWLERFSNEPRSNATSAGAYRTGDFYVGAHGHSIRLDGLDPTNNNASSRAIVVHSAWYVSEAMAGIRGMLGRSEGCFAVAGTSLDDVMTRLGPGRFIYAGKA